ncbi:helix-turn-helix domain-containing protein [Halorientalis brevis]|uniref:Helix-turn-helix domain-containing protein n=1 Tax=Halorientalis brevis TaxID=1126241 RepID=A0ABD6C6I0_9EURY|nr:helix-turn-helix domain-containing protein [Halorientalis brevis]
MSVIASVRLSASDFALGRAFQAVPDATLSVESIVPISSTVMPYVWVETAETGALIDALDETEYVERVTVVAEMEARQLLDIEWDDSPDDLIPVLLETDAIVLEASMRDDEWTFRLRFREYEALSTFSRRCREKDIRIQLQQLYSPSKATDVPQCDLTPEQREVLQTAMEHGYFEVPRAVTLDELGDLLDISDSAASQRLRRGLATLLEATLSETTSDAS